MDEEVDEIVDPAGQDPVVDFHNALVDVVGLSEAQADRLISQDISTATELSYIDDTNLMASFEDNNKPTTGTRVRLLAFRSWSREQQTIFGHGNVDSTLFTDDQQDAILMRKATATKRGGEDMSLLSPSGKEAKEPDPWLGKIQDWRKKKREFLAYVAKRRGVNGVPLAYLLRSENEDDEHYGLFDGSNRALIRNAPLTGSAFNTDNYDLYQLLVTWTSGGTAEAYVDKYRSTEHGRNAWLRILEAMEGQDAKNARIQQADALIDTAFWDRDRPNFTFADYCNKHIRANLELEELGSARDGATQVRRFLAGIKNDNMRSLKGIILDNSLSKADLQQAVIKLSDLWNQSKPTATPRGQREQRGYGGQERERYIGFQARQDRTGRGRGGRGRYSGRGGRNPSPRGSGNWGRGYGRGHGGNDDYIPKEVLDKLTPQQKKFIFEGRDKVRAERLSASGDTSRQVSSVAQAPPAAQLPPTVTFETAIPPKGLPPPSPLNSASSQFGQRASRSLQQGSLQTGKRYIGLASVPDVSTDYLGRFRAEIDTRADTLCAGQAFIPLHYSGRIADVSGFHSQLGTIKGIPIARVATAFDAKDGETIILAANEALFFGTQMEHSLFPPQQLCDNGLRCDPLPRQYSPHSIHGIHDPSTDTHLPFQLHGCISYLPIRLPTERELSTCRYIELTSDAEWLPYDDRFGTQEKPYLSQPNVPRYAAPTSSMHHRSSVDPPTLSRRWGTSLDVAANTLKVTTQRGIRYIDKPFTRAVPYTASTTEPQTSSNPCIL